MTDDELLDLARQARKRAYCRYSGYSVGAALLDENGDVHLGCNVENASYGLTICAERNAVFSAVVRRESDIKAVAVVADGAAAPYPCGACRQVMSEWMPSDAPVTLVCDGEERRTMTMGELLPHAFDGDALP